MIDHVIKIQVTTAVQQRRSGQPPSPVDAYTAGVTQAVSTVCAYLCVCSLFYTFPILYFFFKNNKAHLFSSTNND